jgi:hypothetical protein
MKNPQHTTEMDLVDMLRGKKTWHCAMCQNYAQAKLSYVLLSPKLRRQREEEAKNKIAAEKEIKNQRRDARWASMSEAEKMAARNKPTHSHYPPGGSHHDRLLEEIRDLTVPRYPLNKKRKIQKDKK